MHQSNIIYSILCSSVCQCSDLKVIIILLLIVKSLEREDSQRQGSFQMKWKEETCCNLKP